jgi:low temperature requirement protein LtrA
MPDEYRLPGFLVLAVCELMVPAWAERVAQTPWHPHHIAERYGLFTLIVMGESVLSTTRAFQAALDSGHGKLELVGLAVAALTIVFCCWWLYFNRHTHNRLTSLRRAFTWGYGHWFIFAALAAVGSGLAAAIDYYTQHSHINAVETGYAVAVPVAVFVLAIWYLQVIEFETSFAQIVFLATAVLLLVSPLTGLGIYVVAALLAALVVFDLVLQETGAADGEQVTALEV